MPWNEVSAIDLRREFVTLAKREDVNIRWLCQRYGISPKTGCKWLDRYVQGGIDALDRGNKRQVKCSVRKRMPNQNQ